MLLQHGLEPRTPEGKKRATRHRLIVAAAILFQRRGFYGVGTEEILKLAEAPRGSLYHHFPCGKTDLACGAVAWVSRETVSSIQQLRLAGLDAQRVVKSSADGIAAWMKSTGYTQGSLLAALASCLGSETDKKLHESVAQGYTDITSEYEQMLLVSGLRKQISRSVASAIIADIEGAMLLARARRDTRPIKDASNRLITLITSHGDLDGTA